MNLLDLVASLAMGLGLGAITGMPLGVINVAIIDAVIAGERRHARGLALGGALADATHTLLAFIGLGRLVTARPDLARWLAIAAAIAIIVFAIASWRRRSWPRRHGAPTRDDVSTRDICPPAGRETREGVGPLQASTDTSVVRGLLSGIALTLPNPAALAAWVAVAAMTWPDASVPVAASVAVGVGIGSAVWFTLLGWLVAKVPPDHRALRIVPRVALILFVAIALGGALRSL